MRHDDGSAEGAYAAINADEGEPGTFKDRFCLDTDPHRVPGGALIAAFVIEPEAVYGYLRDEYPQTRTRFCVKRSPRSRGRV